MRAWDIPFDASEKPLSQLRLRDLDSWWKRFSFYSFVGVRHVQVLFAHVDKGGKFS
jgi:hypothetical protein